MLAFLTLIVFLAHAQTFEDHFCSFRKEFHSRPHLSLSQGFRRNPVKNAQIVFLGVEHSNYEEQVYPFVLEELEGSGSRVDCFFLEAEFSPSGKEYLRKFNNGEAVDLDEIRNYNIFIGPKVMKYLRNKKIKAYDVDRNVIDASSYVSWLNSRDEGMADKLVELTGKCKRAFFPIGSSHVSTARKERHTLYERLTEKGIRSYRMGLSIQGRASAIFGSIQGSWIPAASNWSTSLDEESTICRELPRPSREPFIIETKPQDVVASYYNEQLKDFEGEMKDMEFWLYYQCRTKKCEQENETLLMKLKGKGIRFY